MDPGQCPCPEPAQLSRDCWAVEHMAQTSAMMPTGDILSQGHRTEQRLPSPKLETQGHRAPWCQARQKDMQRCARSQHMAALGSFSPGLAPLTASAYSIFIGGLWLPRTPLAPTT